MVLPAQAVEAAEARALQVLGVEGLGGPEQRLEAAAHRAGQLHHRRLPYPHAALGACTED